MVYVADIGIGINLSPRGRRLPVLRQTETAECGLVCLAMVGGFWGLQVDVPTIRQRFAVSSRGMNLAALMKVAQVLGLSSRAVRVELGDLRHLRLPAILHWEFKHFVVLKAVGRRIVIHDPQIGVRRISPEEFGAKFTGVALELWPSREFKVDARPASVSLRALLGQPQGFLALCSKLLVIGGAIQAIALLLPVFTQWGIDNVASTGDIDLLTTLALSLGVLIALQIVMTALRSWSVMSATTAYILRWKMHIFAHMTTLPMSFFELRRVGDITSRYDSVEQIVSILNDSFVEGMLDSTTGFVTIAVLFLYNIPLSWVTLAGAAFYVAVRLILAGAVRDLTQQNLIAGAKENSCLIETVRGMRPIKLFAYEKGRERDWVAAAIEEANATLALSRMQVLFRLLSSFIGATEQVIVFWFSLEMVSQGRMTVGMLVAFTSYRAQFYSSVSGLVDNYISLKTVKIHADRVADIILAEPEEQPQGDSERIGPLSGTLELRGVAFRYGQFEGFALRDVSLCFDEGENVAIVGKSGCGKSTLLSLMIGLAEPIEGEVLYGGIPIKGLGLAKLRREVAVVSQDEMLFSGTIAQNIAAFDANIDFDRVMSCARIACIDAEVVQMPMGYGTLVADLGISLSGGQRQRVCIARALYRTPKVLIMDEATSHLDLDTERRINMAMRQFGMTRIIVAHRPDTIRSADRLVLLKNGRVTADTASGAAYVDIIQAVNSDVASSG